LLVRLDTMMVDVGGGGVEVDVVEVGETVG
jgi:hypothetical protein